MKLENITAEIRPRSEWEAIDLGISLARRHIRDLFKSWMMMVFPICLVLIAICYQQPGWAVFGMWWFKPFFERVVLFDLSRRLFGEVPTKGARWKSFVLQLKSQWLFLLLGVLLTGAGYALHGEGAENVGLAVWFWLAVVGLAFYRSLITRSLTLPVRFLENLKGTAYRKRTQLLSRRSSGAAGGLTILSLLLELGLVWSLTWLVLMMVPTGVEWSPWLVTDWGQLTGEMLTGLHDVFPLSAMVLMAVIYGIAMTLTAWLYVGGGFGLYVNTRTWTEGWDIELNFKRLGQRLSLLLAFTVLGFGEVKAESSKERLAEVMEHKDFEVHKSESKRWVSEENWNMDFGPLAFLGQVLFWIIIASLIALLIWALSKNTHLFRRGAPREVVEPRKMIKTVAGMDITPESLPDDVVAAARDLWGRGQKKEALSVLYRGAISWVVVEDVAHISESDTELDCVRQVKAGGVPDLGEPFEQLTRVWMGAAYGSVFPVEEQMEFIWQRWPFQGRRSS